MTSKTVKFEDQINYVETGKYENRVKLFLISGKITLTESEYKQLGCPLDVTKVEIRIKVIE